MKRLIGATIVALGVAATAAGAQEPVRHVANEVGHATAHAAKKTAKAAEHAGNEVGRATAHAAKTIAGTDDPALMRMAKVSEATARATALRSYPGAQIESVKLEKERGRVAWQYKFRSPGVKGKEKVYVDAQTGRLF